MGCKKGTLLFLFLKNLCRNLLAYFLGWLPKHTDYFLDTIQLSNKIQLHNQPIKLTSW